MGNYNDARQVFTELALDQLTQIKAASATNILTRDQMDVAFVCLQGLKLADAEDKDLAETKRLAAVGEWYLTYLAPRIVNVPRVGETGLLGRRLVLGEEKEDGKIVRLER